MMERRVDNGAAGMVDDGLVEGDSLVHLRQRDGMDRAAEVVAAVMVVGVGVLG